MRKFVVTLLAAGGAALAAGLAPTPVTAAPFPASAVPTQGAGSASGTVALAGVRYRYGNRFYLPYCGHRPCTRRHRGYHPPYPGYYRYRPYYPGYYGYYPYQAPLTICGTMLCYRPRHFIVPAW